MGMVQLAGTPFIPYARYNAARSVCACLALKWWSSTVPVTAHAVAAAVRLQDCLSLPKYYELSDDHGGHKASASLSIAGASFRAAEVFKLL